MKIKQSTLTGRVTRVKATATDYIIAICLIGLGLWGLSAYRAKGLQEYNNHVCDVYGLDENCQ